MPFRPGPPMTSRRPWFPARMMTIVVVVVTAGMTGLGTASCTHDDGATRSDRRGSSGRSEPTKPDTATRPDDDVDAGGGIPAQGLHGFDSPVARTGHGLEQPGSGRPRLLLQ